MEKYRAEIVASEARGGGGEVSHSVAVIALKSTVIMYDNDALRNIILGADQRGLTVAPFTTTPEATYFRATSARTDEAADLETIRLRIEELARDPVYAALQFPHDEPFSPVRPEDQGL